ncbi:MAG: flagellar motor protein MotA, partial [Rhodospirillales bacterium]
MTRPQRYLTRMALFLAVVAAGAGALYAPLMNAFGATPVLNGVILGVLLIGILYNFRSVVILYPEVRWMESFKRARAGGDLAPDDHPPRLLTPMAKMLAEKKGRLILSAPSTRTILDGVGTRLEESRDISRYMIGLLIFLGLLGTFWGLLQTVQAVGKVIGGLTAGGNADFAAAFAELKAGLEAPIGGMGTAFSASLFGLAGSLVLGFLELQAGQAQNRFYNDLEEWLSGLTRLSSGGPGGDDQSVPAYIQALLEQTAESLDNLQRTISRTESDRLAASNNFKVLADHMIALTDQLRAQQQVVQRLMETQTDMR